MDVVLPQELQDYFNEQVIAEQLANLQRVAEAAGIAGGASDYEETLTL